MSNESWELEIDGKWLKSTGGVSGGRVISSLYAKQAQHDVGVWIWLGENIKDALENLKPGKHTLRVARLLNGEGRSTKDPPQIRVVSQPVEVEIIDQRRGANLSFDRLIQADRP